MGYLGYFIKLRILFRPQYHPLARGNDVLGLLPCLDPSSSVLASTSDHHSSALSFIQRLHRITHCLLWHAISSRIHGIGVEHVRLWVSWLRRWRWVHSTLRLVLVLRYVLADTAKVSVAHLMSWLLLRRRGLSLLRLLLLLLLLHTGIGSRGNLSIR